MSVFSLQSVPDVYVNDKILWCARVLTTLYNIFFHHMAEVDHAIILNPDFRSNQKIFLIVCKSKSQKDLRTRSFGSFLHHEWKSDSKPTHIFCVLGPLWCSDLISFTDLSLNHLWKPTSCCKKKRRFR